MEDVTDLINLWSKERELAANTRRAYSLEVERFAYWISHERSMSVQTCTSEHIVEYLDVLRHAPNDQNLQFHTRRRKALSPSSVEQTRRILKAFYEWGVRTRRLVTNPLWDLKPQHNFGNTLIEPPVAPPLVEQATTIETTERALRLASIVHLAFWIGASTTEIASLTINDFEFNNGTGYIWLPLRQSPTKTKIELPAQACETLKSYLAKRYGGNRLVVTGEAPLISSLEGVSAVTGWTIWRTVHTWQC